MPDQAQPHTFTKFLKYIKGADFELDDIIDKIVHTASRPAENSLKLGTVLIVIDYTRGKYLTVSDNVKGITQHSSDELRDGGVKGILELFHPNDLVIFNENVFSKNMEVLRKYSPEDHKYLIFNHNYRIKKKDKSFVNLMQKYYFLTCKKTGMPRYAIAEVTDVTHFQPLSNYISHQIFDYRQENKPELLVNNFYYSGDHDMFTKQETAVMLLLADGLSSKEIGEKLYISANTVKNHRQNMMLKSGCKNVAELISHSIRKGII